MTRLSSEDPISRAIASSFVDFLQNSIQLPHDADTEALEVAIECLSAIFNLDASGPGGARHPELLPEIFRLLLSQGFGGAVGARGQQPLQNAQVSPNSGEGASLAAPGVPDGHQQNRPNGPQSSEQTTAQLDTGLPQPSAPQTPSSEKTPLDQSAAPLGGATPTLGATALASNHPPSSSSREGGPSTPQQSDLKDARHSKASAQSVETSRAPKESGHAGMEERNRELDTVMGEVERSDVAAGADRRKVTGKEKEESQRGGGTSSGSQDAGHEKLKKEADELKKQGNDAIAAGRYYEALELYTQAISIVDSIAIYYANRAAAHTQLGQYDLAIKDCEQSIRLDPHYARAYSRLGLAYFEKGEYQKAIDRGFSKALELDPENAIVKQNLKAAQYKLARQSQHQQNAGQQSHASHQQASSGPTPASNAQPFPPVPQTVQGFANMAANLFTPLASMASRATGSAGQAHASGGFHNFGAAQDQGQPSAPGGHMPQGGGNAQQPSTSFPNSGGQSQQGSEGLRFSFPGVQQQSNGAGAQPTFTFNGGGLQGPEQVQNMLSQMFQAFGPASRQDGGQGGATTSQGFERRPS